jgi:uncharacterized membrane protein
VNLLVFFLLIGVLAAISRLRAAEARSRQLEQRLRSLEGRLQVLETQGRSGEAVTPAAIPETAVLVSSTPSAASEAAAPAAPPPSVTPAIGPPLPAAAAVRAALEELIGGRWLLFAGLAAIVLGVSSFVKFAFDNGWISEPLRVAAGAAAGLLLIAAGLRFRSRGVRLFGHALGGAGIVVLYVSVYAALHFYALIPELAAFALMVIVTAGAALLADRERSQPLAALALVGGFATPLLVGGDRNAQTVLFTYMAVLIGGAAAIVRRRGWHLIGASSYVCTFLLVITWFFSSYESQDWLRTELFLTLYACLFGYLLQVVFSERSGTLSSQLAAAVLATSPLAYHLASVTLLPPHPAAWLVYVIVVTLVALLLAPRLADGWLRVAALVLVGIPMLAWLGALEYPRWYAAGVAAAVAIYAMHLAAQWTQAPRRGSGQAESRPARNPQLLIIYTQLNGLLIAATLYVFLDRHAAAWAAWMVAALAAWNGGLAMLAASRGQRLTLSFTAIAATLAAVALVLAFDGPAVAAGWSAEGVLLEWLALRERSRSLALGGAGLIVLGMLQIVNLLAAPLPVGEQPILNPRALSSVLVIAMLAWLAWRTRGERDAIVLLGRIWLILLANALALTLISADLHAYFTQRIVDASLAREFRSADAAQRAEQVALSVTWALYAVGLVFAGIRRRFAPARYFAILLFGIVVLKVLAVDIAGLDRLYRMLSVLAVGVLLLIASYLYQRTAIDRR